MFDWEWKSGGIKKMSLYKFTHIPLLKNNVILKQKCYKQPQKNAINQIYQPKKKKMYLIKPKKRKEKQNKAPSHP